MAGHIRGHGHLGNKKTALLYFDLKHTALIAISLYTNQHATANEHTIHTLVSNVFLYIYKKNTLLTNVCIVCKLAVAC